MSQYSLILLTILAVSSVGASVVGRCNFLSHGITDIDKAKLLHYHNFYRSLVASGNLSGFPGSQYMELIQWDTVLAAQAQAYADSCNSSRSEASNRSIYPWGTAGENIHIMPITNPGAAANLRLDHAVKAWFDQGKHFNASTLGNYTADNATQDFSQLIWWTTNRVGCGVSMYFSKGEMKRLLVCRYASPGNKVGDEVYRAVNPDKGVCSICNGVTCSQEYSGLCNCYLNSTAACLRQERDAVSQVTHEFRIEKGVASFHNARLNITTNDVYSGFKEAANDITKEYVKNLGPLPHGNWYINEMIVYKSMPNCAVLLNYPDTDTKGRDDFLIHGDNAKKDHSGSVGCIVVAPEMRFELYAKDNLNVVYIAQ